MHRKYCQIARRSGVDTILGWLFWINNHSVRRINTRYRDFTCKKLVASKHAEVHSENVNSSNK
jgi:hypothetical protein